MALPPKNKKNLKVKITEYNGKDQYKEQFLEKNPSFLPRGIDHADLDTGFVDFVTNDLGINVDGKKVPVNFLTLSRWREFTQTWQNSDKYKNVKIPFISVVRNPDAQPGTNPADFKIPIRKTFEYSRVPTWDGNKKGMEIYKVPQPVGVDLLYNVRMFSFKLKEINKLNEKVLQTFASAQSYVNIKGHYFPVMLESVGDESQITDLEGKRYYVQTYEMKLLGYLVNEDEFEVVPTVERSFVSLELCDKKPKSRVNTIVDNTDTDIRVDTTVNFETRSTTETTFTTDIDVTYTGINLINITSYTIRVNGDIVTFPFSIVIGDSVTVTIVKSNSLLDSQIKLVGTTTV